MRVPEPPGWRKPGADLGRAATSMSGRPARPPFAPAPPAAGAARCLQSASMPVRSLVVALVVALTSCSWIAVSPPPRPGERIDPTWLVPCTRSRLPAWIDTIAALSAVPPLIEVGLSLRDTGELDFQAGMMAALAGGALVPFALSAVSGFRTTARCRAWYRARPDSATIGR